MPMASGRLRDGLRASPPACAMESKPMNEPKSTGVAASSVKAGRRTRHLGHGAPFTRQQRGREVGVIVPKPATMTTPPSTNISTMSGTSSFS
jgi:hypothetical protein